MVNATLRTFYVQEESQCPFEADEWNPDSVWIGSADRIVFPHQGFDSAKSRSQRVAIPTSVPAPIVSNVYIVTLL